MCLFKILQGSFLVLLANVGKSTSVEGLCAVCGGDAADGEGRSGAADSIGPGLQLDVQEGRVIVERETEGIELGLAFRPVIQLRLLVDVSQALLVLFETQSEVARLEGLVAEIFAVRGYLEGSLGVRRCRAVLGEVFVGVAEGIGLLDISTEGFVSGELATVGDDGFFRGSVASFGADVFDLADDGFAVEDFAKDHVLTVQMRRRDSGDEKLRAVGVWGCTG